MPRETSLANAFIDSGCPVDWGHPLNRGLLHWWNAVPNLGWRGGLSFRDAVRAGRVSSDGTLQNAPAWRSGSVVLDGSSQYISVPNSSAVQPSPYTLMAVVYPTSLGSGTNDKNVITKGVAPYTWYVSVGGGTLNHYDNASWLSGGTITANAWNYIAATCTSGSTRQIYVNGKQVNSGAAAAVSYNSDSIWIGGRSDIGGTSFFAGQIKHIQMFNRVLSDAQILEWYKELRQGNPNTLRWVSTRDWSFPANGGGGGGNRRRRVLICA